MYSKKREFKILTITSLFNMYTYIKVDDINKLFLSKNISHFKMKMLMIYSFNVDLCVFLLEYT